jgi:hypothetical protein
MAQVEVQDLVDEASYEATLSGITATRKFLVTGLSDQPHKKLYQASLLPGIPQRTQVHPSIPGLVVSSVSVRPVPGSAAMAWVSVAYESPTKNTTTPSEFANTEIEVGATVSALDTSVDKDGNEMVLYHTQETTDEDGNVITKELPPQPGKASVQEPNPYISFQRREPIPFDIDKSINNVGHVNKVQWYGSSPRTWLCTAIRARLDGDAFQVSYEFQYRARTWDVELVYTDPSTGAPVADAVEDVGRAKFQIYPEADFNRLGIVGKGRL